MKEDLVSEKEARLLHRLGYPQGISEYVYGMSMTGMRLTPRYYNTMSRFFIFDAPTAADAIVWKLQNASKLGGDRILIDKNSTGSSGPR